MKALMSLPLSRLTFSMDQSKEIPDLKAKDDDARLRKASNEFEAIFIQQMLKIHLHLYLIYLENYE